MRKESICLVTRQVDNSTLFWANYYLDRGFSVIPLLAKDKKPAISWAEYQKRRPTRDELRTWFSEGDYNIGIVTGKISGIVVVDLDSEEALKYVEDHNFPPAPMVKTGKGYHLYYKHPKDREVRNFQKRDDLPGIDIRGDGGYVMAPSSIHPNGEVYEWVFRQDLEDFEDDPLPKLPEILLVKKQSEKTPLKELYSGVPEGKRNDSLFKITCSLKDRLPLAECLNLCNAVNENYKPPLSMEEVERTVRGVYERYPNPVSQFSTPIDDNKTKKLDLSAFDPFTVLKTGLELQQMDTKVEWIIEKLLPKESITLFHGRGGIGKTWLSLKLAEAVSVGQSFMELSTIETRVYYIDFENSLSVLGERIKKLGIDKVLFWHNSFEDKPPKIDSPEWEKFKKFPPGLLIVDTLRAFQLQDENDSRHMAIIMGRLKELRDLGHTILLLHHTPKSNERIYKGSTAILDLSDHVISLHRVNKPESEDEDDSGQYYRFGTKDKTRYEPFDMFLTFNPDKTFVKAQDPDTEYLEGLRKKMNEFEKEKDHPPIQSEVFKMANEEFDFSQGRTKKLLTKGEDVYWTVERGNARNKKIYHPVFELLKSIYSQKTEKLDSSNDNPVGPDITDGSQGLNEGLPLAECNPVSQETAPKPGFMRPRRRRLAIVD